MRLKAFLTQVVVQLDPSYSDYVGTDGKLIVELDKALYGLMESALLWYQQFLKRVLCFRPKAYLSFIYSGSEWFCLRFC